jgi:hypothetical protein
MYHRFIVRGAGRFLNVYVHIWQVLCTPKTSVREDATDYLTGATPAVSLNDNTRLHRTPLLPIVRWMLSSSRPQNALSNFDKVNASVTMHGYCTLATHLMYIPGCKVWRARTFPNMTPIIRKLSLTVALCLLIWINIYLATISQ